MSEPVPMLSSIIVGHGPEELNHFELEGDVSTDMVRYC